MGILLVPMAFCCNQSCHTCVHRLTYLVPHLINAGDLMLLQIVATICPIVTTESHLGVLPVLRNCCLNALIATSAMLRRWQPGGTSSNLQVSQINSFKFSEHSLWRTHVSEELCLRVRVSSSMSRKRRPFLLQTYFHRLH